MVKTRRSKKTGDRQANCLALMEPIGLTFKHEGWDKYRQKPKQGEIMLIHRCIRCGKISINRVAGDDKSTAILKVFNASLTLSENLKRSLQNVGIRLSVEKDRDEIRKQLFGCLR